MANFITPRFDEARTVYAEEDSSLFLLDLPLPLPGFDHHLSSWLLRDAKNRRDILVDTGPSATIPALERSLRSLGVDKLDILLLTHIHADHAGGVGRLLSIFPEMRILAPEKGRRHLVRPEKLAEGTRATLGADMADAFGPILPVREESLLPPDSPPLEGIAVIETPGHAPHHSSYVFHAPFGKVLFPGEAAGVGLGEAVRSLWIGSPEPPLPAPREPLFSPSFVEGRTCPETPYLFPATPPRLDGAVLERSMQRLLPEQDAKYLCFSHYGWTENVAETLRLAGEQFRSWTGRARRCPAETEDEAVALLLDEVRREDPLLALLPCFIAEQRLKEEFFIKNSLRGIVRWVRSQQ